MKRLLEVEKKDQIVLPFDRRRCYDSDSRSEVNWWYVILYGVRCGLIIHYGIVVVSNQSC